MCVLWSWTVALPPGGPAVGAEEKQAQDELWEAESRSSILLRQEHHTQDCRQTLRISLCLQPAGPAGIWAWRASCHVGHQQQDSLITSKNGVKKEQRETFYIWSFRYQTFIRCTSRSDGENQCVCVYICGKMFTLFAIISPGVSFIQYSRFIFEQYTCEELRNALNPVHTTYWTKN